MTIQLLKDGEALLTATTAHSKGYSVDFLPAQYDGDKTLLQRASPMVTVNVLVDDFVVAARRHGLELGGDYRDCEIRTALVLDDEG